MPSPPAANWARTARHLTEAAARACASWIGKDDKDAADAAAVDALRTRLRDASLSGTVVIGEGEKDDAPYLAPGTTLGADPAVDIAVDPLEGTALVAEERPGALSVLALAPAETMLPLGRAFYMEKLIGPPAVRDALALDAPPQQVVKDVAASLGVPPSDVRIAVQKRPRHDDLVAALRDAGAQVRLFGEGDLSFALLALQPRGQAAEYPDEDNRTVDLLWGIGGAPEGMLAAAAQRVLGGSMRLRLAPRSEAERTRLAEDPALPGVLDRTFIATDLVRTDTVAMALTGVTDGPLLRGLAPTTEGADTLVLSPERGARRVSASTNADV